MEVMDKSEAQAIYNRINQLERELRVPQRLKGIIGGGMAGLVLGGKKNGYLLGSLLSYLGSRKQELTPQQREYILAEIDELKMQLNDFYAEQGIDSPVINSESLSKIRFRTYDFSGKWFELVGKPSLNFHAIVYGIPKSGKSILCVQWANYLAHNFGKVLYIASEEGYGQTLQQKFDEWAVPRSENLFISNAKSFEDIDKACEGFDFVFIDSVNYAHIEVDDLEQIKDNHKRAAFITILQATKGGDFRGSQQYAHNCDVVISVADGIAHGKGRFAAESEVRVFD
jgi:hypothetical protein